MIPVAFDSETDLIQPGRQFPPLVCSSFASEVTGSLLVHQSEGSAILEELLTDPEILLVGHSLAFDFGVAINEYPHLAPLVFAAYDANRVVDTEVRQKLCDIAGGVYKGFDDTEDGHTVKIEYRLEDLAYRHLGRKLDKDTWRLRYGELRDVPLSAWPDGAKQYPLDDARAALDVFYVQEQNAEYLADQYRQARAALWIRWMAGYGLRTDIELTGRMKALAEAKLASVAGELRRAGLLREDTKKRDGTIKPGSRDTKKAHALIVQAYANKGERHPLTDTGLPCLDKKACANSGDPLIMKYGSLGEITTCLRKDIPLLQAGFRVPIHSYFEYIVETGRTASKKPNVQNQKRNKFKYGGEEIGVRECFIPRDGYTFASADYGGLELCTLAEVCAELLGRSTLADALNADKDPHLIIASQITGHAYDFLKAERKRLAKECPYEHKAWKQLIDNARQTGKVANFGFPGGLGPVALCSFAELQYDVILTEDEARKLKYTWLDTWPEMSGYFDMVNRLVNSGFPMIKQLYSDRWRGGVGFTEACNSFFQGLGADLAKAAGYEIARGCYSDPDSPLWGCRIVLFVHDEFVLEAPTHRAHEAAIELSRIMVSVAGQWLKHVKIKAEPVLMARYSKDASTVYGPDGRLVIWGA